jgi:hypothetical protein
MKKITAKLLKPVHIVTLAVIISAVIAGVVYAGSYAEPSCTPTGCNAEAPLNVSTTAQYKGGSLGVHKTTAPVSALDVSGTIAGDGLAIVSNGTFGGNVTVTGNVTSGAFFYSSDRNLKTNIAPLSDSLSKVLQLQGVSFNWKADGTHGIGVIAQDVEKVYPELVTTGTDGYKKVEYGNLVAPLIEAIKAQQKEIDQLKAEISDLQNKK